MKSRVMRAALALHEFTVAELHALSGVKSVTVQGVIDRNPLFFSPLESVATGRRGRKAKRYRLVEKFRKEMEAEINLVFAAGPATLRRPSEAPSVDENFRVAFAAAQSAVQTLSSDEPPSNANSLKDMLSTLMRAARSSLVLAKDSPNHRAFESHYAALQAEVDRLKDERDPVIEPSRPNWLSTHAAMDWLTNWLDERGRILESAKMAHEVEPACDRFDRLMHGGRLKDRGPEELLLPAVGLAARLSQGASADDIAYRIVQLLAEEDVTRSPRMFASLLSCAAVCGAQEALTPVLAAVTRPGFHRTLSGTERQAVLHSIARFARPGPDEAPDSAALISFVMLGLSETRELDLGALLPATVRSDSMSRKKLLQEAASVLYCSPDGTGALDRIEEGRLMRNLAAAMSADEMQALAVVLPGLVLEPAGERFVASLTSRDHGAIRLRDTEEQGLVLSPGRALIGSLVLKKTFQTQIAVGVGSEPAGKLMRLIERQSPTVTVREEPTYEMVDDESTSDGVDFIYQLKKLRAALLGPPRLVPAI